ncbi:MAG: hypothetical protein ABIH89_10120 [Elusimicrobiota bacterium]
MKPVVQLKKDLETLKDPRKAEILSGFFKTGKVNTGKETFSWAYRFRY